MKHKKVVIVLIIILAVILAAVFLRPIVRRMVEKALGPTEITAGFTDELIDCLKDQYGITIPGDARFVKGYNGGNMQDAFIVVVFACPLDNYKVSGRKADFVRQVLNLDEQTYPGIGGAPEQKYGDIFDSTDYQFSGELKNTEVPFTSLEYKITEEELVVRLIGWRCRQTFD